MSLRKTPRQIKTLWKNPHLPRSKKHWNEIKMAAHVVVYYLLKMGAGKLRINRATS